MFDATSVVPSLPDRPTIAFFSKGWGRGHAMPDIAIADAIERIFPEVGIRFVSYGTGAATFRANGKQVIDMQMPDNNPFFDTFVYCIQVVERMRPHLVVTHEEVAPLLAAKSFNIRSLFLTDFFQDPTMLVNKLVEYAEEIVFIGSPGVFTEPPSLRARVRYVGPAVRPLSYRLKDRQRARAELNLPAEGLVLSCMPGSWSEASDPIADVVVGGFEGLSKSEKTLVWLAGRDYEQLRRRLESKSNVIVLKDDWQLDRLMVASDCVVTKSNRTTLRELNALGVPSISLSRGTNWPDDVVAHTLSTNVVVDVKALKVPTFTSLIEQRLIGDRDRGALDLWPDGVQGAAERFIHHLDLTVSHRSAERQVRTISWPKPSANTGA